MLKKKTTLGETEIQQKKTFEVHLPVMYVMKVVGTREQANSAARDLISLHCFQGSRERMYIGGRPCIHGLRDHWVVLPDADTKPTINKCEE
jgi:hypothetical protein